MALTIFGLPGKPHDFPVSRTAETAEACGFLLDFTRPLIRYRQLFNKRRKYFGVTATIHVPVVYVAEDIGGFVIGIDRGQPYFTDVQKLWKKHNGKSRTIRLEKADGFNIAIAFATHFPEDADTPKA